MSNSNQPESVEPMSDVQPTSEEIMSGIQPVSDATMTEASSTVTDSTSSVTEPADLMMAAMESQDVYSEALIYVGPTLKSLPQYSVFTNGIPSYIEPKFERCPELRSLFLPIQEFPTRQGEWNLVGSELYISYQTVLKTKGV